MQCTAVTHTPRTGNIQRRPADAEQLIRASFILVQYADDSRLTTSMQRSPDYGHLQHPEKDNNYGRQKRNRG